MIFVDSSWIIALADEDDQNHDRAVRLLPSLDPKQMVSDLVLSESVSWVGAHLGYRSAQEVFENLFQNPSIKVLFLNKRLAQRSALTYAKYRGKLSFADAVSVRLMQDGKVHEIASFDSDFDGVEGVARIS